MDDTPRSPTPAAAGGPQATLAGVRQAVAAAWAARNARERTLVALAGAVLGAYLLWAVAVVPAWRTLKTAPVRIDQLDGQLQQMQRLAAEAGELRATPPLPPEQAQAVLQSAAARLGEKARLTLQGPRATLAINGMAADELTGWLAEARVGARARVVEGQLNRTPQGLYAGNLVLAIGSGS